MSANSQAWHEAGHALSAHRMGAEVREVTLESDLEGLEGHAVVAWQCSSDEEQLRRLAMVALAGPVAELVFRGEEVLSDLQALCAWRSDWDEAQAQLKRLHREPVRRQEALRQALAELQTAFETEETYEQLARVADALDAHGTLDRGLFLEALGETDSF